MAEQKSSCFVGGPGKILLSLVLLAGVAPATCAAQLKPDLNTPPATTATPGKDDLSQRPPVINAKAQAMLDKTIQALGGSAFLGFKALTTSGRAFAISDEQTAGLVPFENTVEYPDKRHSSYGKKEPVVLINNGDKGWEEDRYGVIVQKRRDMQDWQLANRYNLENLLRVRIHEPGILVQDGGADFVDQAPARILSMVDSKQTQIKVYLHSSTFLPIRITYRLWNPAIKDWDDHAEVYGDYRNIQGIQTPMHITRFLNDERVAEIYRNSAKYNENYPAGYFDEPQH